MFNKNNNVKTLKPEQVCAVSILGKADKLFVLPKDVEAYGTVSGATYQPGRNKAESTDLGQKVMLFWKTLMLSIDTPFLGRLATPEHMYGAQVNLTCRLQEPHAVYRLFLGSANELPLSELTETVGENVRKELSRLACRYSPEAVIQGAARANATKELTTNLKRVYDEQGIEFQKVTLVDISNMIRQKEAEYREKQIACEARERNIELEQAWADQERRLDEAANQGNREAQEAKKTLAGRSAAQIKQKQPARPSSVVADKNKRKAQVETEPVLLAAHNDVGGRCIVLRPNKKPRYANILRSWFCLGRHENCDLTVQANGVSSLHLTVAKIGSGLLLTDHNTTCGTVYNGERITQRFIESGDAFRIGDAWLVFKLEPGQEFREIDRSVRGSMRMNGGTVRPARFQKDKTTNARFAADQTSAMVQLASSAGRHASSDSRPILIGQDSACDLRLADGGVARFHAVVSWDGELDENGNIADAGVFLEDLHSGRGTIVNGQSVRRDRLSDGDIVEVGGHRITVSFTGNIKQRAAALAAVTPKQVNLAMTCINGADESTRLTLKPDAKDIIIGRSSDADKRLQGEEVSGHHARITSEMTEVGGGNYRPALFIEDLNSTNGTSVNRHILKNGEKYKLGPGDIVRLGKGNNHCEFLVHHTV